MSNEIVVSHNGQITIVPQTDDKQMRTRLNKYQAWLDDTGANPLKPDLASYRDHLRSQGMKESSIGVYLAAVRSRYKDIVSDRNVLFAVIPDDLPFPEQKAYVDEITTRINIAIDPRQAPTKQRKIQDRPDSNYLRLTPEQIAEFMSLPDTTTLKGIRDLAIMALMLATGCRTREMANATVKDIRVWFGDELSFHIRHGKGRKERLVPYGELDWMLDYVDLWLELAGISSGFIFRRVYKNGKSIGDKPLTGYAVETIIGSYPVMHKGELVKVKPHDLRRTYAKRAYDAGMTIYRIQKNMGHESESTTKGYIGDLSASERRPPAIYGDIQDKLNAVKQQVRRNQ